VEDACVDAGTDEREADERDCLMVKKYKKPVMDVLFKTIKNYTLAFFVICLGALLLSPDANPFYIVGCMFLVHGWIYFVHRLLHLVPLNTHIIYHHQKPPKSIPRELELFFELFTDLGMNLSLIPFQKLIGINVVPLSVILLFTLAYCSIHIFNYSIIGSTFHRRHHDTLDKNFAPDAMDHIVGTNFNDEFEDLNPTCLNVFGSMALLYPLKEYLV
jgi:hypothetical protein